jgi:glycosyltransferase involved in cell wall biosynthesis
MENPLKKNRILLASVLKPIDDTRMFEKLGRSLVEAGGYEVFIIGYPSKNPPQEADSLHVFPLKRFGRLSFGRLVAGFQIFKIIYQVKPKVLIVNTHELLIVAVANRILFGTRIIYDIQENYWRNILQTNAFPRLVRPFLAAWVRLKEKLTSPFFHWNFLAEKGYEKELGFIGKKFTVIENKVWMPDGFQRKTDPTKTRLLFSGTLAESTGVFEAIELAKKLHGLEPSIELLIIGFCALPQTLKDIKQAIQTSPFITIIGGDSLVPHSQIMEAIATSDFGLVAYRLSPHIENSIPTKLYEYLGCQLPILLQGHSPWVEMCRPYSASVTVNFSNPDFNSVLHQMKNSMFYPTPPTDVTWALEEVKLLGVIEGCAYKKHIETHDNYPPFLIL